MHISSATHVGGGEGGRAHQLAWIMCGAHQSATHVGGGRGQGTPTSVDHVRCTSVSNPCRGGGGEGARGTPTSVDHVRCTSVSKPCRGGGGGAGHTNSRGFMCGAHQSATHVAV